ncbi:MAG: hypothetical protein AAF646_06795 [Pseudomonadota bacterium]
MFLELIAAFAASFAAAGLVMLLNLMTVGRLPKWLMPAAAGAALFGYAVWSEYSWYDRVAGELPRGVDVTFVNEARVMWKPWTFAAPYVNRFVALDTLSIRTNAAVPHQRVMDVYFYGRWSRRTGIEIVVDCAAGAVAPLPSATLDDNGAATDAAWAPPLDGDSTLEVACA